MDKALSINVVSITLVSSIVDALLDLVVLALVSIMALVVLAYRIMAVMACRSIAGLDLGLDLDSTKLGLAHRADLEAQTTLLAAEVSLQGALPAAEAYLQEAELVAALPEADADAVRLQALS